ncbi:hypothetical protein CK203_067456 [Vitis vinifera]|uniref:F-box protein At3g26010-like beta-propeller domain-containing protein n=1 Tax=Vitis vinifera TaxID=29760 RepID=A0A438EC31_VITVI|nr:hypothetical protein CK203_067456 [Vitis vinifera]
MINEMQNVGFLCHYVFGNGSAQYVFLDVGNDGSVSLNRPLSFSVEKSAHVCASCNGMLLFSYNCSGDNLLSFHVFNISAHQYVSLPQLPYITPRIITHGLAFDGLHYQVVLVFSSPQGEEASTSSGSAGGHGGGGVIEMEIFSSETGKWRHHTTMIPLPPYLPKLSTPPLFSNGSIHWELGGYLLVYNIQSAHSELLQLPNHSQNWSWRSMTFGQCLWESDGRVHYCYTDYQGIQTWVLMNRQDHDYYSNNYNHDRQKFKWKLAHTVPHQILLSQNPDIFLRLGQTHHDFSEWKPYYISPYASLEDSQIMYLRLPGIFAAYNLRTGTLKEVCNYSFPNTNFYCCSFFPVVYCQKGNAEMGNIRSDGERGAVINLPVADVLLLCQNSKAKGCSSSDS